MLSKTIPGTNIEYKNSDDAFTVLKPMIEITGGLSLGQLCTITNLNPSTIQNWVKRSYVPRPINKKYTERHISRILMISALRDCMNIEDIGELMVYVNGDTEDESDDIISESKLYDYFCKALKNIDDMSLNDENIESVVRKLIEDENVDNKEKLLKALKIMIYAYISGKCLEQINTNLKQLRG